MLDLVKPPSARALHPRGARTGALERNYLRSNNFECAGQCAAQVLKSGRYDG